MEMNGFYWYLSLLGTLLLFSYAAGASSNSLNCTFESDICSWDRDTSNFRTKWLIKEGDTPSSNTGPSGAHGGTYYIFMEASSPVLYLDKGRLISPSFQPAQESCFTFWYHMYGEDINTFNVLLTGSSGDLTLWSRSNSQGDAWHQAKISLGNASYTPYSKIVFEVIRGKGFRGDIAVDDVTLTPGTCEVVGYDCKEIRKNGNQDGVYNLTLLSTPFLAYCLKGWIVIQRRIDSSLDFDRNWSEYTNGFGTPDKEHWLGLEKLHQLTKNQKWRLRVDLVDQYGDTAFQIYNNFKVGDAASNYTLTLDGGNSGTAGDSLTPTKQFINMNWWPHKKLNLNGQAFSTKDRDNDDYSGKCVIDFQGHGWWYKECVAGSLNGKNGTFGFFWYSWKNTFKTELTGSTMSIQPAGAV